ncbi:response regulator transcription factor [Maritalea mobilis]|uniref:response regulator n=1 Tax=Maritalea mobilis TaxID=483324 RepID=UPI001C975F8B|nr:response regulator transcription factor [Maritalea mobilis]MBY6201031.1 response regulator transcription factor [Maritalea mobilis]
MERVVTMERAAKARKEMPSVLIVDDHVLVTETLGDFLIKEEGFHVDVAMNVRVAEELIAQADHYDVILVDYEGPGMTGLNGLKTLLQANKGAVALFSGVANDTVVERAIRAGASGFIPKSLPPKMLGHAIRIIADGQIFLSSDFILRRSSDSDIPFDLKVREQRVLALLCEGLQNKEIGSELGVEETTVKMDVKSICRKMGVRNRTEAVIMAIKKEMI